MAERRLRVGIIGCGFFAQNHLHGWQEVEGVDLVAVCDRDATRASAAGARFGVPGVYRDAAAMLAAERLDLVDIATTMETHRPLAELAAAHGVAAIVQKPFAPTWEDCVAIAEAFDAAGVPLMVHENFRFQSPMRAVKAVVESGRLGDLFFGRIVFRTGYDIYAGQPYLAEVERFVILDLAIHLLDLARFFLGEVADLACTTQRVNPRVRGEDAATFLMRHAGGATSVVEASYTSRCDPDPFPETVLRLEGRDGSLDLLAGYRMVVTTAAGREEIDVEPAPRPWAAKPWHVIQESVLLAERHFAAAVAAGRPAETSGRDNLRTYALAEAAYEAAARRTVVVPPAGPA